MNNRIVIGALMLLALTSGYLVFSALEYYEEEIDYGWSQSARTNAFLAAELYSKTLDVNATSYDSFLKLGPLTQTDTLFLTSNRLINSEKRVVELLDWVRNGGQLLVAATTADDNLDGTLFDELEITSYETDYVENLEAIDKIVKQLSDDKTTETPTTLDDLLEEHNENLAKDDKANKKNPKLPSEKIITFENNINDSEISTVSFEGTDELLRVHFNPSTALSHEFLYEDNPQGKYNLIYWAGSEYGTQFLQFEYGAGFISVFSDPSPFNNLQINKFDHAYLWQKLIQGPNIAIVYGSNMPSLWTVLMRIMPEALLCAAIFLLAWLWHQMRRFGSTVPINITTRRSFAEHIEAAAAFLWQGRNQHTLLQPVREDIHKRADRIFPHYATASNAEQVALLAQTSGVDANFVKAAMDVDQLITEDSFIRTVKVLQKIRESL